MGNNHWFLLYKCKIHKYICGQNVEFSLTNMVVHKVTTWF